MTQGRITDAEAALKFIRGGNATFTLESTVSGQHFTYKAQAPGEETERGGYKRDLTAKVRFVKLLTGPDNEADYQFMGTLFPDGLKPSPKSHIRSNAPSFKALEWALRHFQAGHMPTTLNFYHEGSCCVCGRKLTVPSSVASGIGPECASKGL